MKFKRPRRFKPSLEMTPLIDVVFLLLIFFLLSSTFVLQSGIKIKLPQARTKELYKEEELYISIDKRGLLYLNEELLSLTDLKERLKSLSIKDPERLIIIKADKEVLHGRVVDVLDCIKEAGLSRLAIATLPKIDTKP